MHVAAILTCYNEGAYIGEAVRSILNQSQAECVAEIVIADDGSAADTLAVLQEIQQWDLRIKVIYGTGGAGLSRQRNTAIASTTSEFIAILDGDDVWTHDKLEQQLPLLESPDVGLVYGNYYTFSAASQDAALQTRVSDLSRATDLTLEYFLNDPPIVPSTAIIRRSAFVTAGGFDASIRVFEDTDLFLRMTRVCRFEFVDAPVLYKRYHVQSITGGRQDLIAHHALVAFRAAATEPRLLNHVLSRLSERARKLGTQMYLLGDRAAAIRHLRIAVRMSPLNVGAWVALLGIGVFPDLLEKFFRAEIRKRRTALGADSESK